MHIREFDYDLPPELVAQHPAEKRDHSRLMILHRRDRRIEHRLFFEITDYLQEGDVLVLNDARVIPARLLGKKETGGRAEVFLLRHLSNGSDHESVWHCLVSCSKKPRSGARILIRESLVAEIMEEMEDGYAVRFTCEGKVTDVLRQAGWMPLPPYIKRDRSLGDDGEDWERYQTVYARSEGAVAAPTAGLHFTEALLNRIREKGVNVLFLTLDVGWGTFQPVREEQIEEHRMHRERYAVPAAVAGALNGARRQKKRVVCVGTTAVRSLESAVMEDGSIARGEGHTDLFIYPGYRFKVVDTLVTNFHLPRSTLVMLVAAFAGNDFIFQAYREAVEQGYRFFSYGDAMLII
jgi:S-adenosylmethionine:tRNA ribosyltransferase-isomerase